jgi:CDP-diacylglycerol---serine O-phosphatidyltransferase
MKTPKDSEDISDVQPSFLTEATRIYFLPNLFTAGNLFFGFVAIIRCIQAKYSLVETVTNTFYTEAVWCILAAFICDALDGRVARLGGKESLFGKEFDSIADVVSFGVAPALMVFFLILSPTEGYEFFRNVGWLIGFIYLLCAGVRLARFNIISSPLIPRNENEPINPNFQGLPVPVAAGLISSLALILIEHDLRHWSIVLPVLMLLIAWLMVSNIPYPSFKTLDWHTTTHLKTFVAGIVFVIIIFVSLRQAAFGLIFLGYIIFGPIDYTKKKLLTKKRNSGQ